MVCPNFTCHATSPSSSAGITTTGSRVVVRKTASFGVGSRNREGQDILQHKTTVRRFLQNASIPVKNVFHRCAFLECLRHNPMDMCLFQGHLNEYVSTEAQRFDSILKCGNINWAVCFPEIRNDISTLKNKLCIHRYIKVYKSTFRKFSIHMYKS